MTMSAPTIATSPNGFAFDLTRYLEVSQAKFRTCIDEVRHEVQLSHHKATMHLQYVRFDPNTGEPKFDILARVLAKHVVRYALKASTRESERETASYDEDEGDLFMIARDLFRKTEDSGEVGELLLFFLLEAAFAAPQVVCKMELKTNPNDEIKGTDGIHIRWNNDQNHLDVYLGEAKLFQSISNAIGSAFASVTRFYDEGRTDDELHLVTAHFKHIDDRLRRAVTRYVNRESSERECNIVHACLIGWDWTEYQKLNSAKRDELVLEFENTYRTFASRINGMLSPRFEGLKHKHITFKFLFLPFSSVGAFRRAFYKALCGVDIGPGNH